MPFENEWPTSSIRNARTVDRERNAILTSEGRVGNTDQERFLLTWNDNVIRISGCPAFLDDAGGDLPILEWQVNISMHDSLKPMTQDVLSLVRESLRAYGYLYSRDNLSDVLVEIDPQIFHFGEENSKAKLANDRNSFDALLRYRDPKLLAILFLGIASGLPLALAGSTLKAWLREDGVDLTAIGFLTSLTLPYSLKFLWAPLIDRLPLGPLTRRFGQRTGWMLFTQTLLIAAILGTALTDPQTGLLWTALGGLTIAFCSASQDIVIDAYRAEYLAREEYAEGAAAAVLGWRVGALISGAGALGLAELLDWRSVYFVMAGIVVLGMATVLVAGEPRIERELRTGRGFRAWLSDAVVSPFATFAEQHHRWLLLLLFIALFRLPESFIGAILIPFELDLGFTKATIGAVGKLFGFGATILGAVLGGVLLHAVGLWRALLVIGLLQIPGNLAFLPLLHTGPEAWALGLAVGMENLVAGALGSLMAAFLMSLCDLRYTGTQYALLSAVATLASTLLANFSGLAAQSWGYGPTFAVSSLFGLPALGLLIALRRHPGLRGLS